MSDSRDEIREKISEIVRKHPEGLTIQEISNFLGIHRQTATKHIFFLEGAGLIRRRRVGSATLHYLNQGKKRRVG